MINTDHIEPDMPIICSEGGQFATVDHMVGPSTIKVNKDEVGQHHFIPVSWVLSIEDGKVNVDRPVDRAMQNWSTSSPNFIDE
jgi:hypothetical protein